MTVEKRALIVLKVAQCVNIMKAFEDFSKTLDAEETQFATEEWDKQCMEKFGISFKEIFDD